MKLLGIFICAVGMSSLYCSGFAPKEWQKFVLGFASCFLFIFGCVTILESFV